MEEGEDCLVDEGIVVVERHGADDLEFGLPAGKEVGLERVVLPPSLGELLRLHSYFIIRRDGSYPGYRGRVGWRVRIALAVSNNPNQTIGRDDGRDGYKHEILEEILITIIPQCLDFFLALMSTSLIMSG
jgi:hypothetical protein